jgi:hypothetical protein
METALERDSIGQVAISDYCLCVGTAAGVILQVGTGLTSATLDRQEREMSPASVAVPSDFDTAVQSVEQALDRTLTAAQQATLRELWQYLRNYPQLLLQIAAYAREERFALEQILFRIQQEDAVRSLTRLVLSPLPRAQRWIVALLTATQGIGLRADQIAAMIGPPNPLPCLQALLDRNLIRQVDDRYYLEVGLGEVLQEGFNAAPWMERVLAHLRPWATTYSRDPQVILRERSLLICVLDWAVQQQQWQEVLQLGQVIEQSFVLAAQWQDWEQILRWMLEAAWALEDERSEALALHQLGTLFFCQERVTLGYDTLTEALKLRQQIGDEVGARVTHRNLDQIKAAVVPPPVERSRWYWGYVTVAAIALLALALFSSSVVQSNASLRSPLQFVR